jgi:hypothetical protein
LEGYSTKYCKLCHEIDYSSKLSDTSMTSMYLIDKIEPLVKFNIQDKTFQLDNQKMYYADFEIKKKD